MKKIFIAIMFAFIAIYPPDKSEGKNSVKSSIAKYEKIKHDILVVQFFKQYDSLNVKVITLQKQLQ